MMTIRRGFVPLAGIVMLLGTFLGSGAARAQTTPPTYSPGTSVPPLCHTGPVDAGTVGSGQTLAVSLGAPFTPGQPVDLKIDGQSAGSKVSPDGCVTAVLALDGCTSAQINGTTGAVTVGTNTLTVTGAGPDGATATQTATFLVKCDPTHTGVLALALTGANVLKATLAALLLIVVGAGLLLAQRRRRASQVH